jgi:hypothetical protein
MFLWKHHPKAKAMAREGCQCHAGKAGFSRQVWTGMFAVPWLCQFKKEAKETDWWRQPVKLWLLKVFWLWLAKMAVTVCWPPHLGGQAGGKN